MRLYSPLIYYWCRKCGLSETDAADIGQEVFSSVARGIGKYRHDQVGASFRGWLRTITVNKVRDWCRRRPPGIDAGGADLLAQLPSIVDGEQKDSGDGKVVDDELILLRQAVEMVLSEFHEETRKAFLRVVVDQMSPAEVAEELGISVNSVYLAKSRVRRRLKEEFSGLIESL
ncbi:MAG: sigma-70 family RNA polymerase sigma factor [Planctomycetes bacterium]|nr:sigma-70 family RNA polymerase sigma factor [Planctomycetota bacterium]